MQAIYFLDGKVIDNIEPLKELKLENLFEGVQISEVRSQISVLLDQIEAMHPGTFESFRTEMISGDHLVISESITRNAHLIHSVIKEINKGDRY
jgi:hypothetical protein